MVGGRLPGDFHSFQKCLIEAGYSTVNTCRAGRRQDPPAAKAAQTAGDKASAPTRLVSAASALPIQPCGYITSLREKAVRSQPAKFGVRLLVIGHGTVSLAAT